MKQYSNTGKKLFIYILAVTLISTALIWINAAMNLAIPFKVDFLIGFVGSALIFVIIHSVLTKGWKITLLMFALSFVIAFTAEALGVNFGWIFGSYHYTEKLGLQFVGVPFLAALAWEPILYASFTITDLLIHSHKPDQKKISHRIVSTLGTALIGAIATTAWDLMIDPIAVSEGWWVWHDGGEYTPYVQNGVPVQNFIGWISVAFVIQTVYRIITDRVYKQTNGNIYLSISGPLTLYCALFVTSFGVAITILHRPEIAMTGMMAMGPFILMSLFNLDFLQKQILKEFKHHLQKA